MTVSSSGKIEPTIERQGKQQCERKPRANLLISGHSLFSFTFPQRCGILNFPFHIFNFQAEKSFPTSSLVFKARDLEEPSLTKNGECEMEN
jgi:hypothetical protein